MDKALNFLSLARKAGTAELGEEPAGAAARAGKAYVLLVASDCGDHTWRRAKSFVSGTDQICIHIPYSKEELGEAVGRQSLAIAAITDVSMALALVKSLPEQEKYAEAIAVLEQKAARQKQRKKEAQAHKKNVRMGKKK